MLLSVFSILQIMNPANYSQFNDGELFGQKAFKVSDNNRYYHVKLCVGRFSMQVTLKFYDSKKL